MLVSSISYINRRNGVESTQISAKKNQQSNYTNNLEGFGNTNNISLNTNSDKSIFNNFVKSIKSLFSKNTPNNQFSINA